MRFVNLVGLVLATAANAAPVIEQSLNSTKWTPDHVLQPGEVILYGSGRMEVVHESVYHELLSSQRLSHGASQVNDASPDIPSAGHNSSGIHSRDSCDLTTAVITDETQNFVDWDVQMSPVVIGTGGGIDVSVSSGYSVSNRISVSAGLDLNLVKDKLDASGGIDYSHTWTTEARVTVKATIADGYSGVMITKPIKTRKLGRVMRGCLGSQTQEGTFSADSYREGSYEGVKWVSGAITTCSKKEFPLSRCSGSGNFV